MQIVALLPDHLVGRVRIALGQGATLRVAGGVWGESGVARVLGSGRFDLLIIDPADRRVEGQAHTVSMLLDQHPLTPVIFYTALALPNIRGIAALLGRVGPREIVIAGADDQPSALRALVLRLTANTLADRLLVAIGPSLARLSPRVERALRSLFATPGRFRGVEDIAATAGITRRHLNRAMSCTGLAPAWRFLVIARVLRAYCLLKRERCSLASIAADLRTAPRILARHIRLITGVAPASSVRSLSEDDLMACCVRALHRTTPEPPGTTRHIRA